MAEAEACRAPSRLMQHMLECSCPSNLDTNAGEGRECDEVLSPPHRPAAREC